MKNAPIILLILTILSYLTMIILAACKVNSTIVMAFGIASAILMVFTVIATVKKGRLI